MSQREPTESFGHLDASGSPKQNLPKLAELARQAYEQKRTKDCLDLTRTILLIDPDNANALWMRSAIQSEMHRDLENARAFLRDAQAKESSGILPEHNPKTISETPQVDLNETETAAPAPHEVPLPSRSPRWRQRLTAQSLLLSLALVALVLVIAGLATFRIKANRVIASEQSSTVLTSSKPTGDLKPETPGPLLLTASAEVSQPWAPALVPPPTVSPLTVDPAPRSSPSAAPDAASAVERPLKAEEPATLASNASRAAVKGQDAPTMRANGTLAVSSPSPIDIYKDDTYIGSAPVSLELSAGPQTLEYRHGNLRKRVTHQINSSETTRAMITFDVDVQINSKPWAEVFLDGVERKPLGQTPLSGVRVPIGGVLVFENPGFPKKRYRVTGNEIGIQNVFP